MSCVGIIAEFNPLHSGHAYLISKAKKHGTVVCAISGNFVQRGDTAIFEKRLRARAALLCGADLVLELPVLWSMSTAQCFALGGISALKGIGCDKIMFGSECGNIQLLENAANALTDADFSRSLSRELKRGVTFAAARQTAAEEKGIDTEILSGANNNLAIEYILAARALDYSPELLTVKRRGARHDSQNEEEFVSASLLRRELKRGNRDFCLKYIPESSAELFLSGNISDISRLDTAILSVLRTRSREELKRLPDLSEGLENKLFSAIRLASGTEELYNMLKVKRYTLARIRRLVLSAFIGIDNEFFMKPLPYVRVLGFNKNGEALLKSAKGGFEIPVVVKASEINDLGDKAQRAFAAECRATDLYALSLNEPCPCGLEYTSKLIKTEC